MKQAKKYLHYMQFGYTRQEKQPMNMYDLSHEEVGEPFAGSTHYFFLLHGYGTKLWLAINSCILEKKNPVKMHGMEFNRLRIEGEDV